MIRLRMWLSADRTGLGGEAFGSHQAHHNAGTQGLEGSFDDVGRNATGAPYLSSIGGLDQNPYVAGRAGGRVDHGNSIIRQPLILKLREMFDQAGAQRIVESVDRADAEGRASHATGTDADLNDRLHARFS